MDTTKESPVILSLCTGLHGLDRGLERAVGKTRIAAYVEIEAFINWNMVAQMELGELAPAPIWTDIKTFNPQPFRDRVHGIIGGYPCQPFSVAGKRDGHNDPRHLWPYIEQHIRTIRPLWCFFENVAGHLTLGFEEVAASLRTMGYAVEAGIFTAEEVGAPHKRERLFILAVRRNYIPQLHQYVVNTHNNGSQAIRTSTTTGKDDSCRRSECIETFGISRTDIEASILPENETGIIELANTTKQGLPQPGFAGIGELSTQDRKRIHDRLEQPGNELANTDHSRSRENIEPSELRANSSEQSSGNSRTPTEGEGDQRRFDRWPARPGQPQYEWEAPRTVEPGVGCKFNGYNFREDLLRALGNAVVEQTAELAFRTFIYKHSVNSTMQ